MRIAETTFYIPEPPPVGIVKPVAASAAVYGRPVCAAWADDASVVCNSFARAARPSGVTPREAPKDSVTLSPEAQRYLHYWRIAHPA